jgi:hypothetical protein
MSSSHSQVLSSYFKLIPTPITQLTSQNFPTNPLDEIPQHIAVISSSIHLKTSPPFFPPSPSPSAKPSSRPQNTPQKATKFPTSVARCLSPRCRKKTARKLSNMQIHSLETRVVSHLILVSDRDDWTLLYSLLCRRTSTRRFFSVRQKKKNFENLQLKFDCRGSGGDSTLVR